MTTEIKKEAYGHTNVRRLFFCSHIFFTDNML